MHKITLKTLTVKFPAIKKYTGTEIQKMRLNENISQPVFAKYLNISVNTVKAMEQGKYKPNGAILKLLNIFDKKGKNALL